MAAPVSMASALRFTEAFAALTDNRPYPWQEELFHLFVSGALPTNINLPTGSGKTSIMPIWLLAMVHQAAQNLQTATIPRRLVWVVNRRVVVDQATDEAERIRNRLTNDAEWPALESIRGSIRKLSLNRKDTDLIAISTLRGEREDNREWSDDPSRPAIVVGTVDMIGSRLLFSGYGDGRYWRVQHAGLLGQDTLIVNDEAHLTPAFASLLSTIEDRQKQTGIKPFRTIRLSATHSSSSCWPKSLTADLENDYFRAIFHANKKLQIDDAGKQFSTLLELATEPGPARTLIFVQRPKDVSEISKRLQKKLGPEDAQRVLTLTGTMRGLERDQMVGTAVFKAFAAAKRPSESYWLVATSAGEVGVNISADRLITELDTVDHLLQRFGRLNRFGETDSAAHVLVSDKDQKDERKKAALAFLRSLPTAGENAFDVSPAALFGRELPGKACTEIPLQAPIHDWLIDVWSQTSLGSHPARPQVGPWLHGNEEDSAQTSIAWRDDVRILASSNVAEEERKVVLQKYRVLAHEQLHEPTISVVENLKLLAQRASPNTPVLSRNLDGSVDVLRLSDIANDKSFSRIASHLLLFPPGCGTIQDGIFSPEAIEVATESLNQGLPALIDVSGCKWDREAGAVINNPERASYRATRNSDGTWTVTRLGAVIPDNEELNDLELDELHRFAAGKGWRFLLKIMPEDEGEENPTALLYFGKARKKTPAIVHLPVQKHLADVGSRAKELGERAGLPQDMVSALEAAGNLHDLGKIEPIWQTAAAGPVKINGELVPIAKPVKVMRGRALGGFRHELASSRYAEKELAKQGLAQEVRDLILHLIAAHHGHARPCFEKKAYDRNMLKESARLALDTLQRFARLQDKYGAWGLAYLESLLRAADAIASDDSAAEEQAEND